MSFGSILFTSKGSALQAKATAGTALTFTKIVMGSGYLNGQSQIALTNVIEPKVTVNISEIKRNGAQAVIKGNFSNESSAVGFYWREIGLFANDPDIGEILYCYGNAGTLAEYIPPESSQLIEKVISIVAVVGNATNVSAVIDSSAFATKADFNMYSEQVSGFSAELAQKANQKDVLQQSNTSQLAIAQFFVSNTDISNYLYLTTDGIKFRKISDVPIMSTRDADCLYNNEKFYVASTHTNETDLFEFSIFVSENIVDWTEHKIILGTLTSQMPHACAPDWFVDTDGKIYITFSKQVGMETETYVDYRPYIVECTDIENLTFGTPRLLNLMDYNMIDTELVKKDSTYYLFIKKEHDQSTYVGGTIMIWSSSNLVDWTLQVQSIPSIQSAGKYEAPCVAKIGNLYYLYVDNYGNDDRSYMHYCTSTDLINWSSLKKIVCNTPTRHGFVYLLEDVKAQNIIKNYLIDAEAGYKSENPFYQNNFKTYIDITSAIANKYIELMNFDVYQNYKGFNIEFNISDIQNSFFNSKVRLSVGYGNGVTARVIFEELNNYNLSVSTRLVLVDCGSGIYKLFYKVTSDTAMTPAISISTNSASHVAYTFIDENIINALPAGIQYVPSKIHYNLDGAVPTFIPTLTNCTIKTGAYYKLGKMIILNIRITASINASASNTIVLTGLPKPVDKSMTYVPCTCDDLTNSTTKYSYLTINGEVGIYGIISGNDYMINAVYISE